MDNNFIYTIANHSSYYIPYDVIPFKQASAIK